MLRGWASPAPRLDVCCDFLAHVRGGHRPGAAERDLLTEAVEATRLEQAAADDRVPVADRPGAERASGAA